VHHFVHQVMLLKTLKTDSEMTNNSNKDVLFEDAAVQIMDKAVFVQSFKAKYLRITIKSDKSVVVTIPRNGSLKTAKEFLHSKIAWIKNHINKIEKSDRLTLPDLDIDLEKAQTQLFERLDYFSNKYGLPYNNATFRCQKTKWGSCSGKNNINLNINMVYLPPELQDYLLLHELVHTKVKHHRREYWNMLNKFTDGRARELSRILKKYKMKFT
jgi:predicted metal-dependent hydrolase